MLACACGLLCGALNGSTSIPRPWAAFLDGLPGADALHDTVEQMARLALVRAQRQAAVAEQVLTLDGTASRA